MPELTLTVSWPEATERVFLGDVSELSVGSVVATTEDWRGTSSRLRYQARVEHLQEKHDSLLVVLRYLEIENPTATPNDAWGTSTLRLHLPGSKGTAVWRDDRPGEEFSSGRRPVAVSTNEDEIDKKLKPVLQRVRKQNRFRKDLLLLYGSCAITGETLPYVLDAAHIREVRGDAGFAPGNGLLLRTDIHRLFDARLLRIENDGRVILKGAAKKAQTYLNVVKKLDPNTLDRVKANLLKRNRADDA